MYDLLVTNLNDVENIHKEYVYTSNFKPHIIISPVNGEKFNCKISVYNLTLKVELEGLVCFFNNGKVIDAYEYIELNKNENLTIKINSISFKIYTLLNDVIEYSKIRYEKTDYGFKKSDFREYNLILQSLNDISYLNSNKNNDFEMFIKSEIFRNFFIKDKRRLRAYGNGYSGQNILIPLKKIPFTVNSMDTFVFKFNHKNDHIYPNNIFSIVGKNGVGKSKALKEIYSVFNTHFNKTQIFANGLISHSHFYRIAKNNNSYINVSKNPRVDSLILNILAFKDTKLASMLFFLLADLFSDERYLNVFIVMNNLIKINISNFFASLGKNETFDLNLLIDEKIKISRIIGNKKFDLSSGERSILNIILNMSLCILQNEGFNLFILDEPENHLHPNFIGQLMNFMNKVLYSSNSYAVIATHSPFIVKNLLKENICVLKQKGTQIVSESITFNTLGANVETISQFIFGNDDLMELEREILKEKLKEYRNKKQDLDLIELSNCLSPELILEIYSQLNSKSAL